MPRPLRSLTALVALLFTLTFAFAASSLPAQAAPRQVSVVVTAPGVLGDGARAAVRMWDRSQSRVDLWLKDLCPSRGECIVIADTWDAWGGYTLDGIEYGGWHKRDGRRCDISLPSVLTSPALTRRWDAMLSAAGQSRHGITAQQWPAYAVTGHEVGHCLGLPDRPSGAGVMSPLGDTTLSAEDLRALRRR